MDIANLFTLRVWLDPTPGALLPASSQILFGVFVGLVVFGVVSKALQGKNTHDHLWAKFWAKVSGFFFWTALTHFVLYFFMREGIPYLGMRLWFFILYILVAVRVFLFARYAVKDMPRLREEREERSQFEKYLPRKKQSSS